eukprot:TRINITY_DN1073_c0_g1_i2.p1 TRINITY_DN1073_c0_g1~~TRINITY_DN1073_c0_g1_i2.p1  ORF type:complete len:400 (+),score=76.02 TRINITY_DN1073_c0_g1_i2:64-1263(+)
MSIIFDNLSFFARDSKANSADATASKNSSLNSSTELHPNNKKKAFGRWTKEEHHRFMEGIKKFGKNWKKVEEYVETRSGAQIRSHAQKFFNRLQKEITKNKSDDSGNASDCTSDTSLTKRKRSNSDDSNFVDHNDTPQDNNILNDINMPSPYEQRQKGYSFEENEKAPPTIEPTFNQFFKNPLLSPPAANRRDQQMRASPIFPLGFPHTMDPRPKMSNDLESFINSFSAMNLLRESRTPYKKDRDPLMFRPFGDPYTTRNFNSGSTVSSSSQNSFIKLSDLVNISSHRMNPTANFDDFMNMNMNMNMNMPMPSRSRRESFKLYSRQEEDEALGEKLVKLRRHSMDDETMIMTDKNSRLDQGTQKSNACLKHLPINLHNTHLNQAPACNINPDKISHHFC